MRNKILEPMIKTSQESASLLIILMIILMLHTIPAQATYQPLTVEDEIGNTSYTKVRRLIIHGGTITNGGNGDITFTTNGDVSAAYNFVDNTLIRGDGGSKGIQDSNIIIDDSENITGVNTLTVNGSTGNTLVVSTNGIVHSATSGFTGFGMTNPNERVTIEGTLSLDEVGSETTTAGYGKIYVASADSELYYLADDQSAVRLTNNGVIAIPYTTVQVDGAAQSANAVTLDFSSTHFTLTESPVDDFDIILAADGIDFAQLSDSLVMDATTTIDMDTNGADLNFDSGTLYIDSSANRIGIGDTAPGAALEVNGTVAYTPSAITSVTAGGGITVTRALMRVQGSGGAVNITANPQIADGTDGQIVVLKGTSDSNTLTLDNGTGLSLTSAAAFTLGSKDTISLIYDALDDEWIEISRSNK